jgi:multicomponent Na+:H+ antiporter subunit F
VVGTLTVLLVAVFGYLTERPDFLDISLLYALINFAGTIAILKFFEYRDLGHPGPGADGTDADGMGDGGAES